MSEVSRVIVYISFTLNHIVTAHYCVLCFASNARILFTQPFQLQCGMLVWLCVWVKVQICIWPSWCHCHSLSLAPVNPDWFYLSGTGSLLPVVVAVVTSFE